MRIGVFDSGIGGKIVADDLSKLLVGDEIQYVNDQNNIPYGNKSINEIISLTKIAIQPLLDNRCDIIVIACNTATTSAIKNLRLSFPKQKFIGFEPMIKPASIITKTKCIAVCATPRTLGSDRYNQLKTTWLKNINTIEPDCSNWAYLIENGLIDELNLNNFIDELTEQNVDVVVLGCTHYHLIKDRIKSIVGNKITILEPTESILKQIKTLQANNF